MHSFHFCPLMTNPVLHFVFFTAGMLSVISLLTKYTMFNPINILKLQPRLVQCSLTLNDYTVACNLKLKPCCLYCHIIDGEIRSQLWYRADRVFSDGFWVPFHYHDGVGNLVVCHGGPSWWVDTHAINIGFNSRSQTVHPMKFRHTIYVIYTVSRFNQIVVFGRNWANYPVTNSASPTENTRKRADNMHVCFLLCIWSVMLVMLGAVS